jgi:hypothetical protein
LPELWLRIFEFATWIPGAFETSNPDIISAFIRDHYGITLHRRFSETNQLKLNLSVVCKQWYRLVTQHLFEYILINSGQQALKVASALEDRLYWNGGRGPGWWTVRLEVALEGVHHWRSKHCDALSRILDNCPNLQVLSTAFCSIDHTFPHSAFVSALTNKKLTVKRLEVRGNVSNVNALVSEFASTLEVLWLLAPRGIWGTAPLAALYLPKLHTLNSSLCSPQSMLTRTWTLPFINTLHIESRLDLEPYLETYGQQLQRVFIPSGFPLSAVLSHCPSLQSFSIGLSHLITDCLTELLPQPNTRFIYIEFGESVIHIEDFVDISPLSIKRCETLARNLIALASKDVFPSLEYIRLFLPSRGFFSYRYAPPIFLDMWESWFTRCATKGIFIQGSYGADDQTADIWDEPFTPYDLLY